MKKERDTIIIRHRKWYVRSKCTDTTITLSVFSDDIEQEKLCHTNDSFIKKKSTMLFCEISYLVIIVSNHARNSSVFLMHYFFDHCVGDVSFPHFIQIIFCPSVIQEKNTKEKKMTRLLWMVYLDTNILTMQCTNKPPDTINIRKLLFFCKTLIKL